MDAINQILHPKTLEEFFHDFYEQQMCFVQHGNKDFFDKILDKSELNNFLARDDIRYPSVRIAKEGYELIKNIYSSEVGIGHDTVQVIDKDKLFGQFNDGATIIIQAAQRYFDNLKRYCLKLNDTFNSPIQANIYITPQNSQGFKPHWDTHDVFILQITGSKKWRIYDSEMKLPTKNQGFRNKDFDQKPISEHIIREGDCMYIPRGGIHDAVTTDTISSHITIGILSYTWLDAIHEFFKDLENDFSFRRSIPFWHESQLKEDYKHLSEAFINRFKNYDIHNSLEKLNSTNDKKRVQMSDNRFLDYMNQANLKVSSCVKLVSENRITVIEDITNELVHIKVFEKTISLPLWLKAAINFIEQSKGNTFTVAEITNIDDDESKLVLAKKMIVEGILSITKL